MVIVLLMQYIITTNAAERSNQIEIFVEMDETISLQIQQDSAIETVARMIERVHCSDCPWILLTLNFHGEHLDFDQTLSSAGIGDGDTLKLMQSYRRQRVVKIGDGEYMFSAPEDIRTIADLREICVAQTGHPKLFTTFQLLLHGDIPASDLDIWDDLDEALLIFELKSKTSWGSRMWWFDCKQHPEFTAIRVTLPNRERVCLRVFDDDTFGDIAQRLGQKGITGQKSFYDGNAERARKKLMNLCS